MAIWNEMECEYTVTPEVSDFNENNLLKPHAYQILIGRAAEEHLNRVGLNVDTIMPLGYAWALVSLSVEIKKQLRCPQPLLVHTWHAGRKGPYFRRELEFKDQAGETVFVAATFSVLFDLGERAVYHKKELPFLLGEPTEKILLEASPAGRKAFRNLEYQVVEERVSRPSYLDCLGHVNNCRYGEFAYDALRPDQYEKLENLKRMDVYFISELRRADRFTVLRADMEQAAVIRGVRT
ncbi:MAG: thioesterase [Oscillospiraceae bacterium]|nr:thioesterase [Oscillospiraceae bacterium]